MILVAVPVGFMLNDEVLLLGIENMNRIFADIFKPDLLHPISTDQIPVEHLMDTDNDLSLLIVKVCTSRATVV